MQPTQEQIDKAKADAGGRELIQIDLIDRGEELLSLVAMAPTRTEYGKFQQDLNEAPTALKKFDAQERLVLAMTKWPERKELELFFQKKPMCLVDACAELAKEVGAASEARSKKL